MFECVQVHVHHGYAPETVDVHLVVDFKVLLVRLNLGSSLRANCYLLDPRLRLGHHPTLSISTIKQFSGAVAEDFGAVARGVLHAQSLYFVFVLLSLFHVLFTCFKILKPPKN